MQKKGSTKIGYRSPIPKNDLIRLAKRSDCRSAINIAIHFGTLALTGFAFVWLIRQGYYVISAPFLMLYGIAFSFLGYAGLGHELQHQSVFCKREVNDVLYYFVSLLTWNNPVYFRASHQCHHKHTLRVGVDYEVSPEPTPLIKEWYKYVFFDWPALKRAWMIFGQNSLSIVRGPFGLKAFPRGSVARGSLVATARIFIAIHAMAAVAFVYTGFLEGVLLVNLAAFICTLPNRACAKLQHDRLATDSDDFRENCRTLILPRWLSLLYWNMNYHIEHHMYPNVPHFNLPALRHLIEHDLPEPTIGIRAGLKALR